uniref:Protein kinase domain-containing protein n=1 Tax=Panagrolaimus sp. JU765 TaxID=591449 RepID=A0AC34QUY2_9BILA
MTIVSGTATVGVSSSTGINGPGSRSNSRNKNSTRFSSTKIRNSSAGGGTSTVGGHPMMGADPNKREIKQRFEITKKLGSGTYGKVSLAYDHKFDREVAVKLIKKSAIENKQDLVRIRREIRIMSALNHPNIIQIFEVFENKDKIILVMEYASGGELYDYVSKNGSLPESEARRIFRQITSAVLYCHKHKVAHRDLKLENILLDVDNNAKIADFGLSNYFNEKSLLSTFCGSPLYASPEIINGTPYRGPEVDCWSLGILLYTLVYGSMPFDGRDFNRMVRQIKRGAYYEPDTPSTASMLIRNMLRVNPERRADIDDIASHWWLNLEENMPVIQELPENQITDHTPLTERAETMVVQDLADETDVFMEFGHLSSETRKKIEEFRRRRKEAEEYNENSPVKPPKAKKMDGNEVPEMASHEKSLRHDGKKPPPLDLKSLDKKNDFSDPLERLRQLENRLQGNRASSSPGRQTPTEKPPTKPSTPTTPKRLPNFPLPPQPASPQIQKKVREIQQGAKVEISVRKTPERSTPVSTTIPSTSAATSAQHWRIETDSLNLLMNQLLEQMEKGPVSMNLVARVKAHPFYDLRPMVKELLESIIAAQPKSVQKQASKIIEQQSHDLVRKQISNHNIDKKFDVTSPVQKTAPQPGPPQIGNRPANKYQVAELPTKVDLKTIHKPTLEDRPWHSVEVGFETDESSDGQEPTPVATETAKPATVKESKSEGEIDIDDEEMEDEDEEEYESEIDELAEVVEQVSTSLPVAKPPKIVENLAKDPSPKESRPEVSANHLSTFDRGLAKRQSKGKYQHNHVELYGRGVSTEAESPPPSRRRIGGPQPTPDQSPVLFDKAKKYIMKYPDKIEDSDEEKDKPKKKEKDWLKTQDPDITDKSNTVTPTSRQDSDYDDSEESEEEEEEEGEIIIHQHKTAIIGYRTITPMGPDGVRKEAPIVPVKPQTPSHSNLANAKPYTSPAMNGIQKQEDSNMTKKVKDVSPPKPITKERSPSKDSSDSYDGMQKWESAAAYIRRKNRERRLRNRTIGAPDEVIQRSRDLKQEIEETVTRKKSDIVAPEISHVKKLSDSQAPLSYTTYSRPSYLDERKLHDYKAPHSYIDRRKSFHETTPTYDDDRHSPGYSHDPFVLAGKYEEELDNWTAGKNRFAVYQTRAEREAQFNTGGMSYRPQPSNYWFGDRTANSYITGSYRTRYDDHLVHRPERPVTPGADHSSQSSSAGYGHSDTTSTSTKEPFLSRLKPTKMTRRISSVLRDSENKRARARSQSTERKLSGKEDDYNIRLMTPEVSSITGSERSDYSYINYHDSASTRTSMPREPDTNLAPARGILKNKQASELEPRATPSMESSGRMRTPGASDLFESSGKKKSFLNLARRRTTEVRIGADGKIITPSFPDDDFKRPRSPIDRIKSLFRKSKDNLSTAGTSTVSTNYHSYNPAGPNSATSRFNTTDKIFGSYPSSTQSSGRQFSRYPAVSNYTPSNRFSSYTPSSSTRHWYEDSHLY